MGMVTVEIDTHSRICGQSKLLERSSAAGSAMIQAGVPQVWLHKDLVAAEWPGNRVNKGRKPRISILNTRFVLMQSTV
jgi:hypothetical protein